MLVAVVLRAIAFSSLGQIMAMNGHLLVFISSMVHLARLKYAMTQGIMAEGFQVEKLGFGPII